MSTIPYDPAFAEIARTLTEHGAFDRELARAFGVHVQTLYDWKRDHPDFAAATKLSKEQMLRVAENALFRRATGYSFESERVFCSPKDGTVTRVATVEHVPPCARAMRYWLEVRRPGTWSDKLGEGYDESVEELCARFTRSRAALAARWTTGPTWPGEDKPDPWITDPDKNLVPTPEELATKAQADAQAAGDEVEAEEREETGPNPLADPRLWPETPDGIDVPLPPAPGTSAYKPSFAKRARLLALQGALDRDLARAFEVHPSNIQRWTLSHPAFAEAVKLGKDVADDAVEQALLRKAAGYSYAAERIFCQQGQITRTPIEIHLPPSAGAARFLLANLGKQRWSAEPDTSVLNRERDATRRQRLYRADIAAAKAFAEGMRGRELQLHVLEQFGVAPEK